MKVSSDRIEGSQVVLNIEVDPDEMEAAVKQAYRRLGARTIVPGFRKGKAPPAMLERYYGREALVEDAAEHLLPEVYDRALREHEVDAVAEPKVEIVQTDPLSFKATVPVRPTVELGDYGQIRFTPEQVEVTPEDVAGALERIREMQAPWEPVERAAGVGDLLSIEVEGKVQDEVVINEKEGWYHLSPDSPGALPGFAEQLQGAQKGEERSFTLTLPSEYGQHGGQDCDFRVLVNEIKEKRLPELDDELAKSLGQGCETLDALKEKMTADLKSRKEWEARSDLEEKAIKALVDLAHVEYPDILVEHEIDRLLDERRRYFGDEKGLEQYLNSVKKSPEEFRGELRPMAERIVIRSLVVQKFADLEGVEVPPGDVEAELDRMVQHNSDERVRQLLDTPAARESIGRNLFMKKAIDRLYELTTSGGAAAAIEDESATVPEKEEGDENGNAAE